MYLYIKRKFRKHYDVSSHYLSVLYFLLGLMTSSCVRNESRVNGGGIGYIDTHNSPKTWYFYEVFQNNSLVVLYEGNVFGYEANKLNDNEVSFVVLTQEGKRKTYKFSLGQSYHIRDNVVFVLNGNQNRQKVLIEKLMHGKGDEVLKKGSGLTDHADVVSDSQDELVK